MGGKWRMALVNVGLGLAACSDGAGRLPAGGRPSSTAPGDSGVSLGPDFGLPGPDTGSRSGSEDLGPRDQGSAPAPCFTAEEPEPREIPTAVDCPDDPDITPEFAWSPSASYFGELAAIQLSDAFHAPRALYMRTREEACRIVATDPRLVAFESPWINKDLSPSLVVSADPDVISQMTRGEYEPWRCLMATLEAEVRLSPNRDDTALVYFEPHVNMQRLVRRVLEMPGILSAIQPIRLGISGTLSCIFERDGVHHYILALIEATTLPEIHRTYWYFEANEDGRVDLIELWEGTNEDERPDVFRQDACF